MRINLATSFADKDVVKALGARWDIARRVWYIENPENLKPFLRWIPQAGGFDESAAAKALKASKPRRRGAKTGKPSSKPNHPSADAAKTTTSALVAHCGCDVLPWLDCVHTK